MGEFPSDGFTGPLTPYKAGFLPTLLQVFPPYKVDVSTASGGPECPVIGHRVPQCSVVRFKCVWEGAFLRLSHVFLPISVP